MAEHDVFKNAAVRAGEEGGCDDFSGHEWCGLELHDRLVAL